MTTPAAAADGGPGPAPRLRRLAVPGLPRPLVTLLGLAAVVVVLAGMWAGREVVAPTVLALVIAVGVHPVQRWLDRFLPRWAAMVLTILVTFLGVVLFMGALVVSVAQFAQVLPDYQAEGRALAESALEGARRFGVSEEQIDSAVTSVDPGSLLALVGGALGVLVGTVGNVAFVLLLLFFLLVDAATVKERMAAVELRAPGVARSLRELSHGIRRYLVVTTVFGLVVAAVDVVILVAFGVPLPLLWGLLSFVTNYIPNIGIFIGLVPPALVALLDGGPVTALWVVLLWLLANFVVQTLVQPKIVGDTVGFSVTVTVLSVLVWAAVLGPLGALLAIPLSLAVKELLVERSEPDDWVAPLVSDWAASNPGTAGAPLVESTPEEDRVTAEAAYPGADPLAGDREEAARGAGGAGRGVEEDSGRDRAGFSPR